MSESKTFVDLMFSKPIYGKTVNIDTKKIVSMINKFDFKTAGSITDSNASSISNSLYVLDEERFKFLKDELMKEFYLFINEIMHYSNKFEITTSWFTKTIKNESSAFHNHANCMLSGILYLQTDENTGKIKFEDFNDKRYKLVPDEHTVINSDAIYYTPHDGLLLLFPSEVYHKFEKNESDIERYSLAFNLIPTGLIGDRLNDSHMKIKVEK
jgi:uncharacterized protein (TIGR02466 family)|tara:strand:+ start:43 stop:678 length:636 start_codon:yes stop_codon:yes gene_type:complete